MPALTRLIYFFVHGPFFCSVFLCPDEMYGDFEDLETGEVHRGQTAQLDPSEVESHHLPQIYGKHETCVCGIYFGSQRCI